MIRIARFRQSTARPMSHSPTRLSPRGAFARRNHGGPSAVNDGAVHHAAHLAMHRLVLGALAALALAVAGFSFLRPVPAAPEVRFTDLSGERFSTADLRGRVTVVSFWSTTCGPCLKEMPDLVARHERYKARGYETVAVAIPSDSPRRIRELAQRRSLPYRVVHDADGEATRDFGSVRITPTTFVIDRQGRVLRRFVGKADWAAFDALVEKALAD
jgi:peroxiredoxin